MKTPRKSWAAIPWIIGGVSAMVVIALTALADVPQPALKITPLGTNVFNIVITNAITTTNYTLLWTPALDHPVYPWQWVAGGGAGQTNFTIDGGEWPFGFFRAVIGNNLDGTGIPIWMDAQPFNPNVGALRIVIDSPLNGALIQ